MKMTIIDPRAPDWLAVMQANLTEQGYAVVTNVVASADCAIARQKLYAVRDTIHHEVGYERLVRAKEHGVLRLIMKYEPYFLTLLENPTMLAIIDATIGNTAILHLQNGFILPSYPIGKTPNNFQNSFHRDFPRYLNGYLASINLLLAIDPFTAENGGTMVVPSTHQVKYPPDEEQIRRKALSVKCPAGAVIVFDSTLWHASGINTSGADRLAINHQFTRSFLKQQIDYVRALGEDYVASLSPRTQQLLGYYTRVPTSLNEYYQPETKRLYRKGQG